MADLRIAIVASRFNHEITERLIMGAQEALRGAAEVSLIHVPGAFEIPLAAKRAALSGRFHAIVAIGCVIRGETAHFEHVAGQAAAGIMRVGLDTGTPVVFGILTTDNLEQALNRSMPDPGAHNVGAEGAAVAVEMVAVVRAARP